MGKKYYAVKKGQTPGIYEDWDECKLQTQGYPGAIFKGFATREEAEAYLLSEGEGFESDFSADINPKAGEAVAYVDGSFDEESGCFASGVVIFFAKEQIRISHKYCDEKMGQLRNVAGEIMGAVEAMRYCLSNNIKKLTIYHDYEGVRAWCLNEWKTERDETREYKAFYDKISGKLSVEFVKVKGHSGVEFNELADYLAKEALGLN